MNRKLDLILLVVCITLLYYIYVCANESEYYEENDHLVNDISVRHNPLVANETIPDLKKEKSIVSEQIAKATDPNLISEELSPSPSSSLVPRSSSSIPNELANNIKKEKQVKKANNSENINVDSASVSQLIDKNIKDIDKAIIRNKSCNLDNLVLIDKTVLTDIKKIVEKV